MSELRDHDSPPAAEFAACFTADVEQDCPPYLQSCRGMTEGLPRFLDLLAATEIRGTLFTTGEMARRFPDLVARIVREGHELGCHGDLHRDFTTLSRAEAEEELRQSLATLRAFGPIVSFRAPYLRFPSEYLPLLSEMGLKIDSSMARYKFGANHRIQTHDSTHRIIDDRNHAAAARTQALVRIPASVTSSVLRLPSLLRRPWLAALRPPVVLFIHPWEAADFRRSSLRWDCRFRTGASALALWRKTIDDLKHDGARFVRMDELTAIAA